MGILRSKKHDLLYKIITPLYGHVFAVSHKVARWHQQRDGISLKRISVVHNGVILDKYSRALDRRAVRLSLGIPEDALLVTTVANINPWKGVDVFIEAAAIVWKQNPNIVFAVAGDWTDGAHLAELRARAESLGITNSVHFLGRVEDVPSLLRSSDVFALLSRSEGFPNVVIEAMAAAIPVVATDVGGTAEALIDGVTGFLVKNEDHLNAASHLLSLLNDSEKRKSFGLAGRLLVEDRFSIRTMVERHVEVYDAILAA
jgi:glycosyltransferase involved in cell wall biosynthesis